MTSDTPSPQPAPPVRLDATALARLRELDPDGRQGLLLRVLALFETTLARMAVQLTAELKDGDAGVVAGVAHTLRSSSAAVGALALAQACAEVERRWRIPDPQRPPSSRELAADVQLLLREAEAVSATLRAMLHP